MGKRLTKIYTRTGDDGSTGIADGTRIDKSSARITAIGDIDELNSILGLLVAAGIGDDISGYLLDIQHRLFDIGGEIATPGSCMVDPGSVTELEELIDSFNKDLPSLQEFILPGGALPGAICHTARAVCRRAERSLITLAKVEFMNPDTCRYINRLSDLLFVFSRVLNRKNGNKEVFWNRDRLKHSV